MDHGLAAAPKPELSPGHSPIREAAVAGGRHRAGRGVSVETDLSLHSMSFRLCVLHSIAARTRSPW